MKAAVRYRYTESIRIEELPRPVPKPNELLVRVRATTVNRTDCAILTGKPAIMKLMLGWPKPRVPVTGTDFAGVVEEAGERVTRFRIGDRVWGFDDAGLRLARRLSHDRRTSRHRPDPRGNFIRRSRRQHGRSALCV